MKTHVKGKGQKPMACRPGVAHRRIGSSLQSQDVDSTVAEW